ncbi:FAD-dependent monooxygenase [Paraburkholderia sartisoli]|uniref:2-polyprenyl-6-methoxyphenol hydroxylase n=1 Tax=Paraburkholderia sartisoli TaxID=83784 RepID=A0A1H4A3V5_9BURK|nr:FAD-dependent monooxygenase [Paraburkholderia sartisoli]SEA30709.1 2-polyprenyl-6-methoxyphenol hydroxylase [Paraburkholderia sartisoli]
MHEHHQDIFDVIIAGAGPVGLFLACELRLFDLSVLVLEQADHPHSSLKRLPSGMRGLSAPTLEAFYRRGLLDEVVAAQHASDAAGKTATTTHWMQQPRRPAGHFAGIQFYHDDIDSAKWPFRVPGPAGTSMAVALETLETVLARRACATGAKILRGFSAGEFQTSDGGVTVHAGAETFRGRWLVGCDGGRSAIRKAGAFNFVGTDPEFTGYSVEVEMADPEVLPPGRHYTPTGMYTYAPPGTIAMVDFDGGAFHRIQPVTLEHVQAVLRRVSGKDITLRKLELATTWTDRAFQATTYRKGPVLLAGDAAHIHSPLGGQGLNLGLGDAMNLGWKLAATIRGDAPTDLLDSYQRERHPVGEDILDWSRAQVALMRPTRSTRAVAAIIRDLIETRDGATYFAGRVWGISLRYDLGGSHPLAGRSAPDFKLVGGTTVGNLLREGKGLLLEFDATASLQALASRWREQVTYLAGDVEERLGLRAVLLRPDGFVAWATETAPRDEDVCEALARWFGKPGNAGG